MIYLYNIYIYIENKIFYALTQKIDNISKTNSTKVLIKSH